MLETAGPNTDTDTNTECYGLKQRPIVAMFGEIWYYVFLMDKPLMLLAASPQYKYSLHYNISSNVQHANSLHVQISPGNIPTTNNDRTRLQLLI